MMDQRKRRELEDALNRADASERSQGVIERLAEREMAENQALKARVAELEAGVRLILAAKGAIQDFDAKTTLRGILTQRGEGEPDANA